MPIMVDSKDVDLAMQRLARQQPTLTTKTGMALSILRRAMLLTPAELDAWLRAGLEPPQKGAEGPRGQGVKS